jgi:hypothetical protein
VRILPVLTIGVNIAAAAATAGLLWFMWFAHEYRLQPDGSWKPNYLADATLIAFAIAPYAALGLLAWLRRRVRAASWGVFVTTIVLAALGLPTVRWESSLPFDDHGKGLFTFLAWLVQCLGVAAAYVLCGIGWLYRRSRAE